MLIEDPDAFMTWLTAVLKPICEADPSALAKYVIALVKKDKSPEALRQSMVSQLEVFLQTETHTFVTQLFKTLETQDYVNAVIPNANPPNPGIAKPEVLTTNKIPPAKQVIPVIEIAASLNETLNGKNAITITKDPDIAKKEPKKVDEKDDKVRRWSRHRSLSRNRSRSRSWDRTRRSRSREKSRERERIDRENKRERGRNWRNKSPPRRYDRRRSMSPAGGGPRQRSRSRSPKHNYRGRYRNRSPPLRSTSRSRSRSGERRDRKDSRGDAKDRDSGTATPTQDSNHAGGGTADLDMRLSQSVQSAVVQTAANDSRAASKRRCRDYDEKGFCMRGEMCPFDHGVDPVVLEDTALSRVLYAPNGAAENLLVPPPVLPSGQNALLHMRPNLPPEYNPQAPQMWHNRPTNFRGGHRSGISGGPPRMPSFPASTLVPPLPNMQQRELISVPVLNSGGTPAQDGFPFTQAPPAAPPMFHHHHDGNGNMFKKKTFDYNRLGPRQKNPINCSLELKKVPLGLNNITHLNNHFAKFGKIVNIQVYYEGDPEAAIVTFSSHAEANAAYRSTEAVLNNRFIKVFWHSSDKQQENSAQAQQTGVQRPVKERLGQAQLPPHLNSNKVLNLVRPKAEKENTNIAVEQSENVENVPKDIESKKEEAKALAALMIKKQELLVAKEKWKKKQEEKRKEAFKITQSLRKRKQELLEKQLAQQKLLIEKMEKAPVGPSRDLLKETIKKSQESIEVIRKDLAQSVLTAAVKPAVPPLTPPSAVNLTQMRRTHEKAQKEILDAELDLISRQAEGADTTDLQRRIVDLKAKIAATSPVAATASVAGRGRGRVVRRFNPYSRHLLSKNNLIDQGTKSYVKNARAQKAPFQSHAVDHRPTRLLVSGYESDEHDNVLSHFGQFGEIIDYVSDAATPSIVLNYKSRKEAEVALAKGKHFQDRTLSVTWCNKAQFNSQLSGRSSSRTVLISESDEDHLIDSVILDCDEELGPELSEEVLLQDDEEEEEENEDRSWRR